MRENLRGSIWLQSIFCRPIWGAHLRMEEQRDLARASAPVVHPGSLSGQNPSDIGRDMGGLDSADGDHLFVAPGRPVSAVRARPFVLGSASNLYDEPFCRKSCSGCTTGA